MSKTQDELQIEAESNIGKTLCFTALPSWPCGGALQYAKVVSVAGITKSGSVYYRLDRKVWRRAIRKNESGTNEAYEKLDDVAWVDDRQYKLTREQLKRYYEEMFGVEMKIIE